MNESYHESCAPLVQLITEDEDGNLPAVTQDLLERNIFTPEALAEHDPRVRVCSTQTHTQVGTVAQSTRENTRPLTPCPRPDRRQLH